MSTPPQGLLEVADRFPVGSLVHLPGRSQAMHVIGWVNLPEIGGFTVVVRSTDIVTLMFVPLHELANLIVVLDPSSENS